MVPSNLDSLFRERNRLGRVSGFRVPGKRSFLVKILNKGLVVTTLVAALPMTACATRQYVVDTVTPVEARAMANSEQINQTQAHVNQIDGQVNALTGQVTEVSATAQEALDRAIAAGKLAEGKFLYSVVLSDESVKFPTNSSDLSPEAMSRLDQLAQSLMAENRNVYLEIQGHTDATGADTFNEDLGRQRAEAVRRYLSQKGVPLSRINTISYGEGVPAAPNETASGRAQNRRVVIQVLS
jgi:peptidoglycan-associated lipoprotein